MNDLTDSALVVPAVPQSAARLRAWLCERMAEAGFAPDQIGEAEMAAGEAFANAIEHGGGSELHVSARLSGENFVLDVGDGGRWKGTRSENRGFGLTIMRDLADGISFVASPNGTRVRLTFTRRR